MKGRKKENERKKMKGRKEESERKKGWKGRESGAQTSALRVLRFLNWARRKLVLRDITRWTDGRSN